MSEERRRAARPYLVKLGQNPEGFIVLRPGVSTLDLRAHIWNTPRLLSEADARGELMTFDHDDGDIDQILDAARRAFAASRSRMP